MQAQGAEGVNVEGPTLNSVGSELRETALTDEQPRFFRLRACPLTCYVPLGTTPSQESHSG
jgi:hypothetical protein